MNPKDFLLSIKDKHYVERDNLCCEYALEQDNCSFTLNNFKPITITSGDNTLTYLVSSDYLCIGEKEDRVRLPLSAPSAQRIMDKFGCTLPTKKMVDQIWQKSEIKLEPSPNGPPYDSSMFSIDKILFHNDKVTKQLINKDSSLLIGGHKKDVVLTNKLYPDNPNKRVAIYGWHKLNGEAIQGPGINSSSHERDYYFDYSHGIRLISKDCTLNGEVMDIFTIFGSNEYSSLISDEGILQFTKY
jgi:hypothetical protein